MPLYVKDHEVDQLTSQIAALRRQSKTEVVRQALRHELERLTGEPTLVDQGVAFVQQFHKRLPVKPQKSIDQAFIDGLYDDA